MNLDQINREADRCVKCGLCLPHCPTYLKLSDEAESPRGRIALIQAFITQRLPSDQKLQRHLDRCLGCRACELACPSGVAYGRLIDAARAVIRIQRKTTVGGLHPWILYLLSNRERLGKLTRMLPLLRRGKLLALASRLAPKRYKRLIQVAELLPDQEATNGLQPAAHTPLGSTLQLFAGCVSSKADQPVIVAAIKLLTQLGYAIDIPSKQVCCGALYRHNGYPDEAQRLCDQTRLQTKVSRAQALITLATACELELLEHQASCLPIVNIIDFVIRHLQAMQTPPNFLPLRTQVAVHTPCSARNDRTIELLYLIPSLEFTPLPENNLCCGAAGSYLLTQPELSERLGHDKLEHLKMISPDILVTSNTGCALQFRLLLKQAGLDIEVLHPIELLQRQLLTPASGT